MPLITIFFLSFHVFYSNLYERNIVSYSDTEIFVNKDDILSRYYKYYEGE